MQKSWTLRVQSPRNVSQDSGSPRSGSARVAFADIMMEAMPDRSIIGRAVYETVPGTGPSLSFELPPESSLLWATVDFNPAVPLRSSTGTWSIACDQRRQSRIGLIWRTEPPRPARSDLARCSSPRGGGPGDDARFRLHTSGIDREPRRLKRGSSSPEWLVWRWLAPTGWPAPSAISLPSSIAVPGATMRSSCRCSSITRWPCAAHCETFDGLIGRELTRRVAESSTTSL